MDLVMHLRTLGKVVEERFPNINNGGCCVYASLVGEMLQLRGVPVRIIVAGNAGAKLDLDEARYYMVDPTRKCEWDAYGFEFCHVGVEFDYNGRTYHHDTTRTALKKSHLWQWKIYKGRLTVREARNLASSGNGWNCFFDRSSIPEIRSAIQLQMRLYDFRNRRNNSLQIVGQTA